MINNPGDEKNSPKPDAGAENNGRKEDPEDVARRERMKELFGDLDDAAELETPETIKADRDRLQLEVINMAARLGRAQDINLALTRKLEEDVQVQIRMKKQMEDQKGFAIEKFVKEFLPLIDNLERGISAISKAQRDADPKLDRIAQGFEKILGSQLAAVFNKFGIKEINPKGECFDPNKHEAVSTHDDPNAESDTVVGVAQKGYELNGRIIRPAKVVVKP